MDSDRWKQVDSLLNSARERPPEERDAFLRDACMDDPALEREVRTLLTAQQQAGSFLETPAIEVAARAITQPGIVGQTISQYEIMQMLGAGGMGVVYKAFDTKLDRLVALKFLPPHVRHDQELKRRLKEEARAASALDHPNIVVIYDIGEAPGGDLFIAMAFHEGATLQNRIGPNQTAVRLPIAEALEIARQVASGLARAHERGIFHRDIKPSNIIVAKDGIARIIDFGLAKSSDATATLDGSTRGTPLYMSPEQASGEAVDFRTDLWSLGAVLYEMLAGRPPFSGDGHLQIMHAIVNKMPPSLRGVRPDLPPEVELIVSRALEKDWAKRYQSAEEMVRDLSTALAALGPPARPSNPRRVIPSKVIAAGAAAVLAIFAARYFYIHPPPKLTDKDTLVLADFTNKTGDAVFDGTLRQGLAVQLEQSPFLSLVSDERIQRVLRLMGDPADARLTPDLAKEVCERTGGAAVLDGSIAPLGSQYVLGQRARSCPTGDLLYQEQAQAARKEDVLNALSQMASKFRTRVGESLATVEKHSTPLAEAATSSLEALKAHSTGLTILSSTGSDAALPFFRRATEIDPQFAAAHVYLGRMYADLGEAVLSADSTRTAWQLRDRASDREKFSITASYQTQVTENLEKAQQTLELWARTYPREALPHDMLSGIVYDVLGKYEKAVEEAGRAIELDPDSATGYILLAYNYQNLNRLREAENTLQRASARKLDFPYFSLMRYDIAFLESDQAGMERTGAAAQGTSGTEDWISGKEAFVLAYSGHLQQARMMTRRAAGLARQAAKRDRAALFETGAALREAFFGNAPEARRSVTAALDLSKSRAVEYGAAYALALLGDSSRSQTLADDLERRFPEDTSVRFSYMPALRGLLALKHGEPFKAIELSQIAVPYELGLPRSAIHGFFGALYPIYVRGEAYLAANRGADAALEFQKIIDRRAIVVSDPIGALARWRLGKALALSGDKAKAKAAYQDFLTLWKDADPDIPILKQVKAEYARLL